MAESPSSSLRRVAIVYKTLPHYRVDFYEGLRSVLAGRGVQLELIVGQPDEVMAQRNDTAEVPWAHRVRNRYVPVGSKQLVWQPCLGELRGAELVIVEQASRLLLNYLLLGWRAVGGPRLGLWGHGLNLDTTSRSRWGEAVKRRLVRRADWWFCYTEGTKALVTSFGMPEDRCTVVQNAIDTSALTAMRAAVTEERHAELRAELGVGNGPVLLWLSSIYPTKRPEFALAAMRALRREMPAVELLVVGDGPQRSVFDAATSEGWVHTVGVATGQRMVEYASLATLIVNPGLVGLTVLDAFALELPMVTCDLDLHSPEYEYLVPEENAVVLPAGASPDEYADALANLLSEPGRLERLREECRRDREAYSVEEMVRRFADGIMEALDERK